MQLAPDVLPYRSDIIDGLMTEVKQTVCWLVAWSERRSLCSVVIFTRVIYDLQQEIIDESQKDADAVFIASMYQMDIDRVQYLISSYLRTRLVKVR